MKIHYNALYLDLLEDLSVHLPISVYDPRLNPEEYVAEMEEWPGMTLKQFQSLALAKTFFKKLEDRASLSCERVALDKFLLSNTGCKNWSLVTESSIDDQLIGSFKQKLYQFYWKTGTLAAVPDFATILDHGRTGPGASLGANGNDFYTKLFSSSLTTTDKALYSYYEGYIDRVPNWSEAERLRVDQFEKHHIVVGNRLSFVPKNHKTARCICTEPSLNMFYQLGVGSLLEDRLRNVFDISLATQPDENKRLARIGSLKGTYSTIDLASASDTVSLKMLESMLPPELFRWLSRTRSKSVTLPDGSVEELHMVSSMGNGFTFPLQTVLFSCIVSAAYDALNIKMHHTIMRGGPRRARKRVKNFGVFGDDIIVVTEAYDTVVRLLNMLGFEVNSEKSFFEGRFRESCGGDYFDGLPARGVYIKSLLTPSSRYVAINRLNEWSATTGIPLCRTVTRLLKSVRFIPTPLAENDDAGVKVPFSMIKDQIGTGSIQRHINYQSIEYTIWAVRPKMIKIRDGTFQVPRGARKRYYNAPGLLEAFLRGDIRMSTLTIRLGSPRYSTKKAQTSRWDYVPTIGKKFPFSQAQLATAIYINFLLI